MKWDALVPSPGAAQHGATRNTAIVSYERSQIPVFPKVPLGGGGGTRPTMTVCANFSTEYLLFEYLPETERNLNVDQVPGDPLSLSTDGRFPCLTTFR